MKAELFEGTLKALQKRLPFRTFTISQFNGERHEVDFPDALIVRGGVAVYLGPGNIPVIFDHDGVNEIIGDLKKQDSN